MVFGQMPETNFYTSLSKQEIRNADLGYYWSKDARIRVKRTLKGYKKQRLKEFKQTIRTEKHWAIWAGLDERDGGKLSTIKKTVDKLTITPSTLTWHPISETRFNLTLALSKIDDIRRDTAHEIADRKSVV